MGVEESLGQWKVPFGPNAGLLDTTVCRRWEGQSRGWTICCSEGVATDWLRVAGWLFSAYPRLLAPLCQDRPQCPASEWGIWDSRGPLPPQPCGLGEQTAERSQPKAPAARNRAETAQAGTSGHSENLLQFQLDSFCFVCIRAVCTNPVHFSLTPHLLPFSPPLSRLPFPFN